MFPPSRDVCLSSSAAFSLRDAGQAGKQRPDIVAGTGITEEQANIPVSNITLLQ